MQYGTALLRNPQQPQYVQRGHVLVGSGGIA